MFGAILTMLSFVMIAPPPLPAVAQTQPVSYRQLSAATGAPGANGGRDAGQPALAYDSLRQRYLLAYVSDQEPGANNEYHIYGQLLRSNMAFLSNSNPTQNQSDPAPFQISTTAAREDQTSTRSRDTADRIWRPALVYNSVAREYLVVYPATRTRTTADDEYEIYGRRVSEDGIPLDAEFMISDQGPPGDVAFDARIATIAFNPSANNNAGAYLVLWQGTTLITNDDSEMEIFGRMVNSDGSMPAPQFRISNFGPDDDPTYDAQGPAAAANPIRNEFLITFAAIAPTNEQEVYGYRLDENGGRIGAILRLSDMGPDGDGNYDAFGPTMTFNPDAEEYLVVFPGVDVVLGEAEIYGQLLDGEARETGPNDFRISDVGTYGSPLFDAFGPDVSYNPGSREYLVTWQADDHFDNDREIFVQRLTFDGIEIGVDDERLSFHGPAESANYQAGHPAVIGSGPNDQFLVAWTSDDDNPDFGTLENEYEIYGQLFSSAPAVAAVRSIPATADDLIREIEGVEVEITSLIVEFSKSMTNPSGSTVQGDVDNPANYRLIDAGRNQQADTTACGVIQNDDRLLELNSVSYDEGSRRVALTPRDPLGAGFYRLILCDNLQDLRGRFLDGDRNGVSGADFSRSFSVLSDAARPWLVLLYLAGDDIEPGAAAIQTSLTEPIQRLLGRLSSMPDNPAVRIVALYDGNRKGDSRIFVRESNGLRDVTADVAASPLWPAFPADRELDSGGISTLQNFIRWARTSYPGSANHMLAVVDHGGGWAPDFGAAQPRGRTNVQSGGWRGMSLDLGSEGGTSFSTADTRQALAELGALGEFDVVFFDACLMGMVETAYEVRDFTQYYLAGQNLLWAELAYDRYLAPQNLHANTSPRQLSEQIINLYNADAPAGQPYTIAAIDSQRLIDVVGLVNSLGQYLLSEIKAGGARAALAENLLREAYAATQKFDYDSSFTIDPTDGYVDLADFARNLSDLVAKLPEDAAMSAAVRRDIGGNAATLRQAIWDEGGFTSAVFAQRIVNGKVRIDGVERTWDFARASGLAIYLPLGERDKRPTGITSGGAPLDESQITYYANPDQLSFSRDAGPWGAMIDAIDASTPPRDPARGDFNTPFPLGETRIYLPLLNE